MMKSKAFFAALAGATVLQADPLWAVDITTPTTIYTGTEYGSNYIFLNSSLRFGTVDTEATLTGTLVFDRGGVGRLSATTSSILNVPSVSLGLGYDLTLGSAVDQGTLVFENATFNGGSPPFPPRSSMTVAGGTVIFKDSLRVVAPFGAVQIDSGASVVLGPSGVLFHSVSNLTGAGILDGSGRSMTLNGASFDGEIRNVDVLTINNYGSTTAASLGGILTNVNRLQVTDGSFFNLEQTQIVDTIAASIANLSSISVGAGAELQFGVTDLTLRNLTGSGTIRGVGDITIDGGTFDGAFETANDLIFTGTSTWGGSLVSAAGVIVADGARLTVNSSSVFNGGVPVEIDGFFGANSDVRFGVLSGDGAIVTRADLTVGAGGASSQFDGSVYSSFGGELIKAGGGTLTFGQTSSIWGNARIDDGSLVIQTSNANGDIENNASVVFDLGSRDDTYSGTLSGSGVFTKLGNGLLTLSGTNAFSGTFEVFGGGLLTDALGLQGDVVNIALVTFNELSSGTYASDMSGSGGLVKTGAGRLNWTGVGTFTGGTEVQEGLLSVNGSLGGPVTIHDGARLGGAGIVGSFDALDGATIAPGNSIGTLNIVGNATFAAGSVYDVEVDGLGHADMMDVGGVLTVSSGASVLVGPENGVDTGIDYASPITYRIATASGGVNGTFGSVSDSFAFLDSALSYDANNIYLTLTRLSFSDSAGTPNEQEVGSALDSLPNGPVTDALLGVTDAERSRALRALSGEIHASIGQGLIDSGAAQRDSVLQTLADPGRGRFWTVAHGTSNRWRTDEVASGGSLQGGGVTFGGDLYQSGSMTLGILAGYDHLSMDLSEAPAEADVESVYLGAYGALQANNMALRFGGVYARHEIDTNRSVSFSSLAERLVANYSGDTLQAFGELSTEIARNDIAVQPFVGAAVIYGRQNAFSETGGFAALSGQADEDLLAQTSLGIRFDHNLTVGERAIRLYGALGWNQMLGDDRASATLAFDGGSDFTVQGSQSARHSGMIKLGLATQIAEGATFDINYSAQLASGDTRQSVKAGLQVAF
ncbi:autotransporter outer membrane beta-barrel domain-containing protein [Rhizobium wuzhouense]|uniref:autotransporter outer membrane beta-barrel domain-containing protein n=1 Tax=Rhizobium wuzhouense TaxID=1986026 RepID=UPI001FE1918E|nr:autotransporter domain-containing protein [Rhizobium wuzhouense]